MKPDFSHLYAILGIEPGCSLEEFRQAYRRRIAELHPDRATPGGGRDAESALTDLNTAYDSAMRFHKQHGRLPGAMPQVSRAVPGTPAMPIQDAGAARATPTPAADPAANTDSAPRENRKLTIALLALLCVLFGLVMWESSTPGAVGGASTAPGSGPAAVSDPEVAAARLELGMDKESVIAIQGNPMNASGDDWFYGPSWIRFEDERLIDWHSSPLYRLKTGSSAQGPEPTDE